MKKLIFIISLIAIMALMCIAVGAKEIAPVKDTYYVVQSSNSEAAVNIQAEGKNIVVIDDLMTTNGTDMGIFFNEVADNDHIELIFAENIHTYRNAENRGILINRPITVTIRYNGYVHAVEDRCAKTGIYVKHVNAYLRCFGTKALNEGEIPTEFVKPTFANDKLVTTGNVDAYHGKVYVWVDDGFVYMENMRTYSGEEGLFSRDGSDGSVYENYKLLNCALGSDTTALGLIGRGGSKKIIEIDNCYIRGKFEACTVMTGSYVKNTVVTGDFFMDCWEISGQLFEFEDCTIVGSIKTESGRTHLKFTNCTFDPSKLALGSDGGGACSLQAITTATCEKAGSKIVYGANDKVGTVDTVYASENPALGHKTECDIYYDSYLENGRYGTCINCGMIMADESINTSPLFIFMGYSTPEDGSYGIVASFIVNVKAIEQYESKTGKTLSYGIVAGAKTLLGENNPLDKDGNATVLETGSVVKADISREYASYDFVLTGMKESQLNVELVIATYVEVTENEEKSIVYLQSEQKTNALSVISYNTIPTK